MVTTNKINQKHEAQLEKKGFVINELNDNESFKFNWLEFSRHIGGIKQHLYIQVCPIYVNGNLKQTWFFPNIDGNNNCYVHRIESDMVRGFEFNNKHDVEYCGKVWDYQWCKLHDHLSMRLFVPKESTKITVKEYSESIDYVFS